MVCMPIKQATPKNCLSVKQAAEHLAVSEQTIAKLIKAKRLRAVKVGRRIVVPADAISDFVKANPA
jgi:excisionase family DNA binding protein